MTSLPNEPGPLLLYTRASENAAAEILNAYSTSFGITTRLLGPRHRTHVRNIYALVRLADEIVDGVTAEAGMTPDEQRISLDRLEEETRRAIQLGYSSNPIVHVFAHTARVAGIDATLTAPFFSSMRTDLLSAESVGGSVDFSGPKLCFNNTEHANYVFGSAEVVGLMCLRVFLRSETPNARDWHAMEYGARRLGAAFQNVNFLRDIGEDTRRLGRSYLSAEGRIGDEVKDLWVAEIRAQLADAEAALPLLPQDARVAVSAALRLFARLCDRIAHTSADDLYRQRVRVPVVEKSWVIAQAILDAGKGKAWQCGRP